MIACICGSSDFELIDRPSYEVSPTGDTKPSNGKHSKFGRCTICGLVHQLSIPFEDENGFKDFYAHYAPTTSAYKAKDWKHDLELAKRRCDVYGITDSVNKRILDVGSGSGAFVKECRDRHQDAYGCELATYKYAEVNAFVYRRLFESINFPTDHFDLVTCHDVLEHSLDPVRMLSEMFRITKQEGSCIIDIPRFFHESGAHHWKDIEHIWMFSEDQLVALLKRVGFLITNITHPIESKVVFYCSKPVQNRVKILVPPGIGDSYWSLVKMRAFLRKNNLGLPDVYIAVTPHPKYPKGHLRTFPYLDMVPFVHSSWNIVENRILPQKFWWEVYGERGRTIVPNIGGCDYLLSWNGHLRYGVPLTDVDPDLECEWEVPLFVSLSQEAFTAKCRNEFGRYIVFYYGCLGSSRLWQQRMSLGSVACLTAEIGRRTGCKVVFMGAQWDLDDPGVQFIVNHIEDKVDLRNKTTVGEAFGLIRGAELVFGTQQGMMINAAMLGLPTVLWWWDWYHDNCPYIIADPKLTGKTHFPVNLRALDQDQLVELAVAIVQGRADSSYVLTPRTVRSMCPEAKDHGER